MPPRTSAPPAGGLYGDRWGKKQGRERRFFRIPQYRPPKRLTAVEGGREGLGSRTFLCELWARRPQSATPASTTNASPIARSEEGSTPQARIGGIPRRPPQEAPQFPLVPFSDPR